MAALVHIVLSPLRLLRAPVRLMLVALGVKRAKRVYKLPVAGLEQQKASQIVFTLSRAATTDEVGRHCTEWAAIS